jgi:citrate synthase
MKIGRQDRRFTAICASNAETIVVRGRDLCTELIGRVGFTDYTWLLITGELPTPQQRAVLDATLLAIAEHGLVPSVVAARMTLAAGPEALQGAVAAGLLGCGSVVLGSSEVAGRFLHDVVGRAEGGDIGVAAQAVIAELRAQKPLSAFTAIVRGNYPEIWANTRAEFGLVRDGGGRATVTVQVYSKTEDAAYDFTLTKERAGWRIYGVLRHEPRKAGRA